ncbi:acetoin utilization protein AcuC [Nisaea acidiphila]|uniref:Acetoin utilization protein AcuC n=1 Tax=Nisaea acidiphila TaxID=1862145 RepID=A0A9J7AU79_9PROT|nr:acetoin utilization protein AcuC [Nisaea acidiphila]UUX50041.1 acetoin utilization protein AcuC [Nisaea acidiphila]
MSAEVSQFDPPSSARIPASFPDRPFMIGSEIYRRSRYGVKHPLSIQRVTPVMDLARALGLVGEDRFVDSPMATPEELSRFHAPDYVAAIMRAERDRQVSDAVKEKYNIGRAGNPVFPEIFSRPATAAGASLLAGRTLAGVERGIIHSLAGGTHHGRPDMAFGFCFFNDPVLGILAMLDGGLSRIAYVDLDAHHGDGVQDAFHDEDRVLTVSIHEEDRWPRTGPADDRAGGMARNFPAPKGLNDTEFRFLVAEGVRPIVESFGPDAIVIQSGCDALADDPQSKLELSNNALWEAVDRLVRLAPRVLVLGGGGYNPWAVARCWTGIWAALNGQDPRGIALNAESESVLRGLFWNHSRGRNPPEHWFTRLADAPREGAVRQEVVDLARAVL